MVAYCTSYQTRPSRRSCGPVSGCDRVRASRPALHPGLVVGTPPPRLHHFRAGTPYRHVDMCVCVFVGSCSAPKIIKVVGQNFPWLGRAGLAHCLPEIRKTTFILVLPVKPFLAQGLDHCPDEFGIGQDKSAS